MKKDSTYPSSGMAGGLGLTGSTIRLPIPQQSNNSIHSPSHSHSHANTSSGLRHQRKAKAPVVLQALEEGESTVSLDESVVPALKRKD
eukprot:gene21961-28432_t